VAGVGVGLAIPINSITRQVIATLMAEGHVTPGLPRPRRHSRPAPSVVGFPVRPEDRTAH
jgi:hypothetical protein